jgi:eukaryotic-like serine/threonine-protein kinase
MSTMQTALHEEPGRIIAGRYRLGGVIGTGGMATVHRAWDLHLDRAVAVKLYLPSADPVAHRRFRDESRTLASLSHPALVAVYDAGTDLDQRYLALQLVAGPNLRERLGDGPLAPDEVRALGARLADALAHVHAAGVIHRDVKPANVLLDEWSRPYLADFGISRLIDSTRLTSADHFMGTPAYLAPEQVLGAEVGAPADVYALGLVLLECLTGRLEYPGTDIEAAVARLHRAPVLPDDLPDDLAAVIKAMTRRDPEQRPTAARCAELLAQGAAVPQVDTAPISLLRAPASRRPIHRLAAAATAVLVSGLGWALIAAAESPSSVPVQQPVFHVPAAPPSTTGSAAEPATQSPHVVTEVVTVVTTTVVTAPPAPPPAPVKAPDPERQKGKGKGKSGGGSDDGDSDDEDSDD